MYLEGLAHSLKSWNSTDVFGDLAIPLEALGWNPWVVIHIQWIHCLFLVCDDISSTRIFPVTCWRCEEGTLFYLPSYICHSQMTNSFYVVSCIHTMMTVHFEPVHHDLQFFFFVSCEKKQLYRCACCAVLCTHSFPLLQIKKVVHCFFHRTLHAGGTRRYQKNDVGSTIQVSSDKDDSRARVRPLTAVIDHVHVSRV